jgi:hypothetical protein
MSLGTKRCQQAASTAADNEHIGVDENAVELPHRFTMASAGS